MPEDLEQIQTEPEDTKRAEGDDTQEDGDYTGPAGKGDLPADLVRALEGIRNKVDQRELQPRINQVASRQKARLFWQGKQYLQKAESGSGSQGTIYAPKPESDDDDKMYAFNIYLGFGKSFVATFAQAPVGVRFEPNDPNVSSDVEAAREADTAVRIICKVNNQKDLQAEIARIAYTDGVVVLLAQQVTDGEKYGFNPDGTPRSYPEIEVGGLLEWKIPIASSKMEDWDYAREQREIALTVAKRDYPDKAKKLEGVATKDYDYSRQARLSCAEGLGLQTQSGDQQTFNTTRSRYWFTSAAFEECEDPTCREQLKDYFPKGARAVWVGETYVESADEALMDHISAFKAIKGDGWNTPGLGDVEIGPQETFNDGMNLAQVMFKRGVPHSFFDEKLLPAEARKNQKSRPGEAHPIDLPAGEDINQKFYQESPAQAPDTLGVFLSNVQGPLSQFLTGQQAALWGGEMGEAGKTASGYQQSLAQAMGLMGLTWVPFKKAWSISMRQCVRILAVSYDQGTVLSTVLSANNGDQETVALNVDNLKGQYLSYPDTDENFPESWTAKKAAYSNLMLAADKNPVLGQILSHPDNLRLAKDLVGIPDLTIPGADSCEKQMKEIEEMEKQAPVPDPKAVAQVQQAQAMGQEVPPEMLSNLTLISSVEIQKRDDDATELATCVRWLNSPAGQKAYRENKDWYQNVSLHADAHEERINSQKQASQAKPPSESINFKDLPPAGKAQMAGQAGIQLSVTDIAAQDAAQAAQKTAQQPTA